MNVEEELDFMFEEVKKWIETNNTLSNATFNSNIFKDKIPDATNIFQYLIDEELIIDVNQKPIITIKGRRFDGYVKQKADKDAEIKRRLDFDDRLSYGTLILAIGTLLLLLVEVLKWYSGD